MSQISRRFSSISRQISLWAAMISGLTASEAPAKPSAGGAAMRLDQVNAARWDRAWTNLVNDVEQSFVPSLPRLLAVEVQLVVANPNQGKDKDAQDEDALTLTVLDNTGQPLISVVRTVLPADSARAFVLLPNDGIAVQPGQTYWIRVSGGLLFGWKYVVGGYPNGEARFNGKPLLRDARSTFLFRTFGSD